MKKHLIHPSLFKLDGGAMFGIIPKPLWEKKIQSDELNRIDMALRIILIRTEHRNILIDTGIGDYHNEKFKSQFDIRPTYENHLTELLKEEHSLNSDEITDIIITHLHFDHVGGLTDGNGDILFKNATIHLHKDHFNYSKNPTLRDSGSFHSHLFLKALSKYQQLNQLNYLNENEGVIISDGNDKIEYMTSFGHTPYMIHPIFDEYIYMADLVPMSHHISIPWVMGYDIEPGTTTKYKEEFYKKIIHKNYSMIFEHDIEVWGGKIHINAKQRYELKELFYSKGLPSEEF